MKKKKEKEEGREKVESYNSARVESQNDLLLSATKSASKATPPRHSDNNPKTPSQEGRPLKMPHQFPLEMPFDISVVNQSVPLSPSRKPTRRGTLIPAPTAEAPKKGRPVGSTNKIPHSQSIAGMEFR